MKTMQNRISSESFANAQVGKPGIERRYRDALIMWLRWNEAYELATAQMFSPGQSAPKIEALMDNMDELRFSAISLSHELLD